MAIGSEAGVYSEAVNLAENGAELQRLGPCDDLGGPSVDPSDGSCWLTLSYQEDLTWRTEVLHVTPAGQWSACVQRSLRVSRPAPVQADHSCWFLESEYSTDDRAWHHDVVHLAYNGLELARVSGFRGGDDRRLTQDWPALYADPVDGSCWVAEGGWPERVRLVHLAADGTELWRGEPLGRVSYLSLNPTDGSCWVGGGAQVVHLVRTGDMGFLDVGVRHWAFDEIEACGSAGIVSGYGDGLYHPEGAVTRDQMAVYVARALVAPSGEAVLADWVPADPQNFPDLPTDHWAYAHVEYCVENGVVAGYDDGYYRPEYRVSRADMAVYMARALVAPEGEEGLADYVPADPRNFPDVPDTFWAYKHIEYCVENGVVAGYPEGNYYPDNTVTRDQMAVYIARAFGLAT